MEEGKTIEVTEADFEQEVLESGVPVLVDFWATWCAACRQAGPVLDKIAEQYEGKLKVCKLDVEQGRQTAVKYGVTSIPTLSFFKGGEVVDQIIGVTPNYESDLKEKIESHLEK
jgi:thioredoxin 1